MAAPDHANRLAATRAPRKDLVLTSNLLMFRVGGARFSGATPNNFAREREAHAAAGKRLQEFRRAGGGTADWSRARRCPADRRPLEHWRSAAGTSRSWPRERS